MKICLINNLFKPYNKGGAEQIVELLSKGFENRGDQVFLISTYQGKFKKVANNYLLKSRYYNLEKIPIFFRLFWHIYDMLDFISALKIRKIIKKENPDLIITNNLKGISYLVPLFLPKDKKHFHILHDIQLLHPSGLMYWGREKILESFFAKIYMKINIFLFSKVSQIISPSKWLLNLHFEKGFFKNAQARIIPNPIVIEKKDKLINKKSDENFIFLFVGQIEEHKGIVFLLDFFKKYLVSNNKIKLKIIGAGSLLNNLKQEFLFYNNIEFLGRLSNDEVKIEMQKADCLIVPSLCYENSPTVIYEAFANNLIVLASDIGGIKELLDIFGGFLFEPMNENDLRKKIDYLINRKGISILFNSFSSSRERRDKLSAEGLIYNYQKNNFKKEIKNFEINEYINKILL